MTTATPKSTKFFWNTYEVPRFPPEVPAEDDEDAELPPPDRFTIRSLKQGATGAVRTWPAAEVLLDYLVRRGGMRDVRDKLADDGGDGAVLDMTRAPPSPDILGCHRASRRRPTPTYNVMELGAGSGYLGVGLALAMNREACLKTPFRPRVRVLCTDNDRATIKNMRYNVAQQPNRAVNKAVRVESLGWGDGVGGEKFSNAVGSQFREKEKLRCVRNSANDIDGKGHSQKESIEALDSSASAKESATSQPKDVSSKENEETASKSEITRYSTANLDGNPKDPLRLLTHLIASDVLWGRTTLEPLSSVISAIKLRNPGIVVTLLITERSPGAVEDLKERIEEKVRRRLQVEPEHATELQGFLVSIRQVIHENSLNMKLVEC